MVQDANGADNFAGYLSFSLTLYIGWIADNERCASCFFTASDTDSFATLVKNLIDCGVQHVGTSVDSAETTERFWETT